MSEVTNITKGNINQVVTWSTKKVDGGFQFTVTSFDHGVDTITHKTGIASTRARASAQAKQWAKYIKQLRDAA